MVNYSQRNGYLPIIENQVFGRDCERTSIKGESILSKEIVLVSLTESVLVEKDITNLVKEKLKTLESKINPSTYSLLESTIFNLSENAKAKFRKFETRDTEEPGETNVEVMLGYIPLSKVRPEYDAALYESLLTNPELASLGFGTNWGIALAMRPSGLFEDKYLKDIEGTNPRYNEKEPLRKQIRDGFNCLSYFLKDKKLIDVLRRKKYSIIQELELAGDLPRIIEAYEVNLIARTN